MLKEPVTVHFWARDSQLHPNWEHVGVSDVRSLKDVAILTLNLLDELKKVRGWSSPVVEWSLKDTPPKR